ncbi:DUF4328 domain-containing protein [Gimesia panareensis]|nr:DUF4328 domain-containing protein [Gimesia panareensis]
MSVFAYRNESGFSRFLIFLIVLSAVLNGVAFGSSVMMHEMILAAQKGAEVTAVEAGIHNERQIVIGGAQLGAAIFVGVVFLVWVYRMSRNAHSIENAKLQYSPGWAVGWYFIPIVNLWKPYQAMREIYEVFINRPNDGKILPLWWFAWILASIMARISTRVVTKSDTLDQLLTKSEVTIFADACAVFLDLAAILLVITVSRACAARFEVNHFEAVTEDWE